MSQPPAAASPLNTRLYNLEYPRSLGVYSTYQEVQAVVDTLADNSFPVERTMIVGTDLKLMERVTGRKTWGKVIGQGVLSGLWMGLFLGLLLMFISQSNLVIVLTSVLMGIVFFTVWAAVGYAMTGGKRDFTSMVATIPMQYELMVEHTNADQARRILADAGAAPPQPTSPQSAIPGGPGFGAAPGGAPTGAPGSTLTDAPGDGRPSYGQSGPTGSGQGPAPSTRPTYGQPAPAAAQPSPPQAPGGRPTYGKPADAPEQSPEPGQGVSGHAPAAGQQDDRGQVPSNGAQGTYGASGYPYGTSGYQYGQQPEQQSEQPHGDARGSDQGSSDQGSPDQRSSDQSR